jgi:hypothetical protein
VTAIVLALFARFFIKLARRSRAAAHLVDHDAGRPPAVRRGRPSGRPDDRRAA